MTILDRVADPFPPILKAAGLMAAMFRGLNMIFMLPVSAGQHADAARHIDDTARTGFGDHGS